MTLLPLVRSLRRRSRVAGRSNAALVAQTHRNVQREAERKGIALPYVLQKRLSPAAGLDGGPYDIRPIDALLRLSRATALRLPQRTAAVSRWWPVLRYLGAFADQPRGRLRISPDATRDLHGNERRVFSEELGVGFGLLLAERWCRAMGSVGTISPIDTALVIADPTIPVTQMSKLIPDYILRYHHPSSPGASRFAVVECKGTQHASGAPAQLGHAVRQIDSLQFAGRALPGVAISTVSNTAGVSFLAVDPPDEGAPFEVTDEALWEARDADVGAEVEVENARVRVTTDRLLRTAVLLDNAALAAFGADERVAREWSPSAQRRLFAGDGPPPRRIEQGAWTGSLMTMDAPGGRVEMFAGVASSVLDALRSTRESEVREAQEAFTRSRVSSADTYLEEGEEGEARAVGTDGSLLTVRVSPGT